MIPKIIHYCWFGNAPMPKYQQKYLNDWQKLMPDYEIKLWNEESLDIMNIPFARQAYEDRKFAFVADYTRVYALYNEGGIYLDTDVKVLKSFDPFLKHGFFTSYEYHLKYKKEKDVLAMLTPDGQRIDKSILKVPDIGLMSAIIGGEKGNSLLKDCLDFYDNNEFREVFAKRLTIPTVLALHAEKYGFRYKDELQYLEKDIVIYPIRIFPCYDQVTKESVAVHYSEGSWVKRSPLGKVKRKLYMIKPLRKIVQSFKRKIS